MQIVLVRHGQSTNNARYAQAAAGQGAVTLGDGQAPSSVRDYPGRVPDPELSVLGVRQAQALGQALRERRIAVAPTHVYASPMTRAVQTAQPLAEVTDLPVVLHPDAYEVGGVHVVDPRTCTRQPRPGATLQELRERCPSVEVARGLFAAPDQPWNGGLETEEDQALPRAARLLASLRAGHGPDDVVLVVTHQHFCQFVLAAAFGWTGPPWRRFRVDNTGHRSLRLDDRGAFVDWINRVDHLDPADVTN